MTPDTLFQSIGRYRYHVCILRASLAGFLKKSCTTTFALKLLSFKEEETFLSLTTRYFQKRFIDLGRDLIGQLEKIYENRVQHIEYFEILALFYLAKTEI